MYAPAEIEIRTREIAQISIGKNSELKHWDRDRLNRPLKSYLRSQRGTRRYLQSVRGQESDQTCVGARQNRMTHSGRIAEVIRRRIRSEINHKAIRPVGIQELHPGKIRGR